MYKYSKSLISSFFVEHPVLCYVGSEFYNNIGIDIATLYRIRNK